MLERLKEEVYQANLDLPRLELVQSTWGNVSSFDKKSGYFVIKPSGIRYENLKITDMVVVDLENKVVEGELSPSTDTPTHAALYKAFPGINGIVHTHSTCASAWAQAGMDVPVLGTTHADVFNGPVPCARFLTKKEIDTGYEKETGRIIAETFKERGLDPLKVPGVLLRGHGSFTWDNNVRSAVTNALVLEEICKMNLLTLQLNSSTIKLPQEILNKHYSRKNGTNAYYGQN